MGDAEDTPNQPSKGLTRIFSDQRVTAILTAVSIVVASAFGLIMLQSPTTELTAQVLSGDELTLSPKVSGLVGHYTYDGKDVEHLWKMRVNFVNTGDRTLVGMGPSCNVLYEELQFEFPPETRVLKTEIELDRVGTTVTIYEENKVKIEFEQWRKGENLIGSFFVASDVPDGHVPLPTAAARQVIDGGVYVQNLLEQEEPPSTTYLDTLPRPVMLIIILITLAFSAIMIFLGGVLLFAVPQYIRWVQWKARYFEEFEEYIMNKKDTDKFLHRGDYYLKNPKYLLRTEWSDFQGKPCPNYTTNTFWSTASSAIAGLIIVSTFTLLAIDFLYRVGIFS